MNGISTHESDRVLRKMNVAYYMAKSNIAFRQYPGILNMLKREGNLEDILVYRIQMRWQRVNL